MHSKRQLPTPATRTTRPSATAASIALPSGLAIAPSWSDIPSAVRSLLSSVRPLALTPRALGRRGERRAAWFYRLRGYAIVARNLRLHAGEIDLVARRGDTVAIVEVKTRQSRAAGEGFEAVDSRKRERLIRLGDEYAASHPGVQLRYDILSLHWTGWRFEVKHFADAFRPVADALQPWKWRA